MNGQDQVGMLPLSVRFEQCPFHVHVITAIQVPIPNSSLLAILGFQIPDEGVMMEVSDVAFSLS